MGRGARGVSAVSSAAGKPRLEVARRSLALWRALGLCVALGALAISSACSSAKPSELPAQEDWILAVLSAWPAAISERSFPADEPSAFIGSQSGGGGLLP